MNATRNVVRYAGRDDDLAERVEIALKRTGWQVSRVGTPISYVRHLLATRSQIHRFNVGQELLWFKQNFAPIILELDDRNSASKDLVREIKAAYAGLPVIVIGSSSRLEPLAVARLDGADAMFSKSNLDLDELVQAVAAAVDRVAKWRDHLEFCIRKSTPI